MRRVVNCFNPSQIFRHAEFDGVNLLFEIFYIFTSSTHSIRKNIVDFPEQIVKVRFAQRCWRINFTHQHLGTFILNSYIRTRLVFSSQKKNPLDWSGSIAQIKTRKSSSAPFYSNFYCISHKLGFSPCIYYTIPPAKSCQGSINSLAIDRIFRL